MARNKPYTSGRYKIFGKIKFHLFLGQKFKSPRGNPQELVVNSKIVIEIITVASMLNLAEDKDGPPRDLI